MKTNLEALASHLVLAEESLIRVGQAQPWNGKLVSLYQFGSSWSSAPLSHGASSGIVVTVAIKDHPLKQSGLLLEMWKAQPTVILIKDISERSLLNTETKCAAGFALLNLPKGKKFRP